MEAIYLLDHMNSLPSVDATVPGSNIQKQDGRHSHGISSTSELLAPPSLLVSNQNQIMEVLQSTMTLHHLRQSVLLLLHPILPTLQLPHHFPMILLDYR